MAQAIALVGAVIESQNGSSMSYYKRCNFCGDTPNSTTSGSIPSYNSVLHSTFRCNKCGKTTELKIKGV